jgi:tetratricopeptide (TPR) repeat protein
MVTREVFLVSTNGGINFYIGNNAHYDDVVASRPGFHRESYLAVVDGVFKDARSQTDVSSKFYSRGMDYIITNPGGYIRLLGKKFYLFWHGREILRDSSSYFFSGYSLILRLLLWQWIIFFPFGLIAPFAIPGMVLGWKRNKDFRCCVVFLLIYTGTIMLFFSTARYRLPLVPILLIAAALALAEIIRSLKRHRRKAAGVLAVIFTLVILLNLPGPVSRVNPDIIYAATPYYQLGEIYFRNRSWDEALDEYSRVARMIPGDTDFESLFRTNVNQIIGDIYLEKNEPGKAIRYFLRDIQDNPEEKTTYSRLIMTLADIGETGEARAMLEKGEVKFGKDFFRRERERLAGEGTGGDDVLH